MKKGILLLFAVFCSGSAFASGYTIANNWRWKKDVGGVNTTGNWIAPVSKAPVISMPGTLRLRLSTFTTADYTSTSADQIVLQYRTEPQSNSNTTISSTAGSWNDVAVGDSSTTSEPFIINSSYVGALGNLSSGTIPQIAKVSGGDNNQALHEDINDADGGETFRRVTALSTSNNAAIVGQSVPEGGYEIEYRLVFTKNAAPGQIYYFRLINKKNSGAGSGTVDSWDYASGFPSIAISADYNGAVNADLPDLRAQIQSGGGAYVTGTSRTGVIRITNPGSVSTSGPIKVNIIPPANWTVNIASPASGWAYSAGVLSTSTVTLAAGDAQNFTYTMVNNTAGFAAGLLQVIVDAAVIDGNGVNDTAISQVYKQL